MAASAKFVHRIAVGRPEGPNSSTLRVWCERNSSDVFVSMRELGADLKVSLHESGECHSGLTSEAARANEAQLGRLGGSRHQHVWQRHRMLGSGSAAALYCCFPASQLSHWRTSPPKSDISWLSPPDAGHTVSVHCVYSGALRPDHDWPAMLRGVKLIASHVLSNGEKFWLLWEEHLTTPMEKKIVAYSHSVSSESIVPLKLAVSDRLPGARMTGFGLDPGAHEAFMVDLLAAPERPAL